MKFQTAPTGQLLASPIGAHVTMEYEGRTLLGEVTGMYLKLEEGETFKVLIVKFFNGEPWPIEPWFLRVDVLERTYQEEES